VSEPHDYNPNSPDSQFSILITRLNQQDVFLRAIHTQTKLTNGRVTRLEQWKIYVVGFAAGVSAIVAAIWKLFFH
jgi:hypothetical protein